MKKVNMAENQLVKTALDAVKMETGLRIDVQPAPNDPDSGIDGAAVFRHNDTEQVVFFEARKTVQPAQLPRLEALKKKYHPFLLIAEYLYPKMKQQLRMEGINYLEVNGNMWLKTDNLLLFKEDQTMPPPEKVRGRAFTKTGLRLVFQLLDNNDLVNLTYRELAAATGVGFGNINIILTDLKEQGFLMPLDKQTYQLNRKKELLDKWMMGYEQKLKPDLYLGNFRFLEPKDFIEWERIELKHDKTWWGGEAGGNMLTNYLLPERLTLYTTEKRGDLMRHYKVVPDDNGNVEVYEKFWKHNTMQDAFVPTLLIYVDLMLTGDRRCIETAQKIWNEKLEDKF